MSEQQTDLDAVVDELREFEAGDTVTLVTDAESITATVTDTRWDPDDATVALTDRDDRCVRVSTEWYGGWLDPLVDASSTSADGDGAGFDSDPALGRPIGTLVDARLVTAADREEQHGRP